MLRFVVALGALGACGGAGGGGRECAGPRVARLDSWWTVEIGKTYWVDMVLDGGSWRPADHIPMPHHHATRLALTNQEDFPELASAERARLVVAITSRRIEQVRERQWFTTYRARIVERCVEPGR